MPVTWMVDRGFAAVAVWRTMWEQAEHVVCRRKHLARLIAYQDGGGQWHAGDLAPARPQLRHMATAETMRVVPRGRQQRPKAQRVPVAIWVCPIRLQDATNVRRAGDGEPVVKTRWRVEVRLPETHLEPWGLLTDGPVGDASRAGHLCRMDRQRWAVEARVTCTKDGLGWEAVHGRDVEAVRTLVAVAWVAAGFLDELGVT